MKRQLFYALAAMAAFLPVSCASTSKTGADSVSPFELVPVPDTKIQGMFKASKIYLKDFAYLKQYLPNRYNNFYNYQNLKFV